MTVRRLFHSSVRCVAMSMVVVMVAACATTGGGSDGYLTPAEQQLLSSTERFNETVATGAVVGTLLGAVAGALIGGRDNWAEGAAIGAAAGAMAGGAAGYYVADENEQYANRQTSMGARIDSAQREVNSFREIAALSQRVANENQSKLRALQQQLRRGQITMGQYREQARSAEMVNQRLEMALEEGHKVRDRMDADAERSYGRAGADLAEASDEIAHHLQTIRNSQYRIAQSLAAGPQG